MDTMQVILTYQFDSQAIIINTKEIFYLSDILSIIKIAYQICTFLAFNLKKAISKINKCLIKSMED